MKFLPATRRGALGMAVAAITGTILCAAAGLTTARAQELEWVRFAGGGYDFGESITVAPSGDAYAVLLGGSPFQVGDLGFTNTFRMTRFLVRARADGSVAWAQPIESPAFNLVPIPSLRVVLESTGTVLVGGTFAESLSLGTDPVRATNAPAPPVVTVPDPASHDVFLSRWSATGELLQSRRWGGGSGLQTCTAVCPLPGGDLTLGGSFVAGMELSPNDWFRAPEGHWVARFDEAWEPRWLVSIAGASPWQEGPRLASDAAGNVVVAGGYQGELEPGGGFLELPSEQNFYVGKLAPDGQFRWVRAWGDSQRRLVNAVALDGDGSVYVAVEMSAAISDPPAELIFAEGVRVTARAFLLKLDADGNPTWVIPGSFASLKAVADGRIYGTGLIQGSRQVGGKSFVSVGRSDVLLARWDSTGAVDWARAFSDSGIDEPGDLAVGPEGSVWAVGGSTHLTGSVFPVPTFSGTDAFLARYVAPATGLPRIVQSPVGLKRVAGAEAVFSVELAEAAAWEFQWFHQGVAVTNDARIEGARSAQLTIRAVERSDEGDYNVRVTGAGGSVLSDSARLQVLAPVRFTRVEPLPESTLRLTFAGNLGTTYRFEVSDDLVRWAVLTNSGPNTPNPGEIVVVDRAAPGVFSRFYRALTGAE